MQKKNQWVFSIQHQINAAHYNYCDTDKSLLLKPFFTVDNMGVVSQVMTLDRETDAMHSFSVRVCDTGDTHCV